MTQTKKPKLLYAASTASHLKRFHMPYIQALREEYDVYLLGTEGEGIDFAINFSKGFFSPANFLAIPKVRKILKREKFDRVIVNTTLAAFVIRMAMIGLRHRPKLLNVVHGYLFSKPITGLKAKLLLFCEKLLRKKTDALAVMNDEDLSIAKQYRLTNGEISFLYGMGIPDQVPSIAYDHNLRVRYASEQTDFLCTFVGELSSRKNQIFLIRAAERLQREGVPIRLLLAGEGGMREELETEIERLHANEYVFLPGNLEPILPYLAITDLYVSASVSEGLPFNVMEAMAMGLPVVMSDTKGQSDLHQNDQSILYPLNDTEAFCQALKRVWESKTYGMNTCSYPYLERYRLSAVFDENVRILKGENET